jgi:hypothetical protein
MYVMAVAQQRLLSKSTKKMNRRGRPLVVYFTKEQAERLNITCRERHVAKATVVRFAVERFLDQLSSGQLEFPFGL